MTTQKKDLTASRGSASASNPTAHQYASPMVSICHESVKRDLKEVKRSICNWQKKHRQDRQEAYCIPIPPMQVPTCRAIRMLMLKPDKAAMPSRKTACIFRAMPVNLPEHKRVSVSCHTGIWLQETGNGRHGSAQEMDVTVVH